MTNPKFNKYGYNMKALLFGSMLVFTLLACKNPDEQNLLAFGNVPGDLFISLAHPFELANDDYEVVISAPRSIKSVSLCEVEESTGVCGAEFPSRLIFANEQRNFFVSRYSALLEHGLILALIGRDSEVGNVLDMRTISFYNNQDPTPGSGGRGLQGNGGNPIYQGQNGLFPGGTAQNGLSPDAIERSNCAVAGCHSNYQSFSLAQKADALGSGRMPRGRPISPEDRDILLRYFNGG